MDKDKHTHEHQLTPLPLFRDNKNRAADSNARTSTNFRGCCWASVRLHSSSTVEGGGGWGQRHTTVLSLARSRGNPESVKVPAGGGGFHPSKRLECYQTLCQKAKTPCHEAHGAAKLLSMAAE